MAKILRILLLGPIGILLCGAESYGLDLKASEIRGRTKRNAVAVLQNRYFTKTYRPEVGFAVGSFVNEAYTDTSLTGYRGAFFFSEWLGVEVQRFDTTVTDSDDRRALNDIKYPGPDGQVLSPDPEVNPVYGAQDVNLVFAPFYGKLNLMDQMILYSDLYITTGLSRVETLQGELNSYSLGIGQRYYFMKSLAFRADFRDRIYTETRSGQKATKHAYSVDFGLSYFFL